MLINDIMAEIIMSQRNDKNPTLMHKMYVVLKMQMQLCGNDILQCICNAILSIWVN